MVTCLGLMRICSGVVVTYCYDHAAKDIFHERMQTCVGGYFKPLDEINYLRHSHVSEYQRSHELYAYEHFVHGAHNNANFEPDCSKADLEYVPLLPLYWHGGYNGDTECTAGGQNCGKDVSMCSYRKLVSNIVDYWQLVQMRDNQTHPRKFTVASTFNLRSVIGFGMPSQDRRGEVWKAVSAFTEATMLGSYERIVQCPDLLRRQFKHIVELPYIPLVSELYPKRTTEFYFSGRLKLWGPERVCGVRAMLAATLPLRSDTKVVDVTYTSLGAPEIDLVHSLASSEFCIVAKSNSYSTSTFYSAIANGCIPVVISDWFYFAFPTKINYDAFVVRISEEQFLRNPSVALDAVLAQYSAEKRHLMRDEMIKAADTLSWGVPGSVRAAHLLDNYMLPEMMGVESDPDGYIGYSGCTKWDPQQCPAAVYTRPIAVPEAPDVRSHLCKNAPRLIGKYKLVLFMQCARVLWPIKAGNLKGADTAAGGLGGTEKTFLWKFHNLSRDTTETWRGSWDTYPVPPADAAQNTQRVEVYPGRFQAPTFD